LLRARAGSRDLAAMSDFCNTFVVWLGGLTVA
jgi:hypothetical protein